METGAYMDIGKKGDETVNYNKLKGIVATKGITMSKMCEETGVNFSTLWRQCKNGKLPILTVKKIIDNLHLTREEVNYVFFED